MKKKNPLFIQLVTFNIVTRKYVTEQTTRGGSYDELRPPDYFVICPLEVSDPDGFESNGHFEVLGFRICRTTKSEK